MKSFKSFLSEETKSSFGVNLKGEHVGNGLYHLGNHIYARHESKGYKTSNGDAREAVTVHHDWSKDPEKQKSQYRDVHMPEKQIGYVTMEKKKGGKAKFTSHVKDKTLSLTSNQHHTKEHSSFHKAFKHILNSQDEIKKREGKAALAAASMHSYRNFSQDGNRS